MGVDNLPGLSAAGGLSRRNALGRPPNCATRGGKRRAAHYERPSMSRVQYGSRTDRQLAARLLNVVERG